MVDRDREELCWIAGFEGDRRVVLAQLGPYRRLFQRPRDYVRRWHHRVYDLAIEDWEIPLESPSLGPLCTLSTTLAIRFQPTLAFARANQESLANLGERVRRQCHWLLKDAAEQVLKSMDSVHWLDEGHARLEREIEDLVQELLAMREIQSRCRCRVEARFGDIDPARLEEDLTSADPARNAIALEILRRRRETLERAARERQEEQLLDQRLKLEHQQCQLELLKRETELLRELQDEQILQAREALRGDESREAEKIASEIRLRRERIRLEAELKHMELEASIQQKNEWASNHADVHEHLKREIELLAMERQRLALEEEVHKTRLARARGWIIGAKRRFSLGPRDDEPVEVHVAEDPRSGG